LSLLEDIQGKKKRLARNRKDCEKQLEPFHPLTNEEKDCVSQQQMTGTL
jgi:hypothetical protein